jgi:RNA-binding protein
MDDLTAKQRAHLRALGHTLKPLLHVGKEGVTQEAAEALEEALSKRELLKLRVLEAAPEPARESALALASRVAGVQIVQVVGRTALVYRAHPEKPVIRLPHPRKRQA